MAAWAGLVGPVLFTLTWVAQELARIEEYSPIEETVSALEAGPNGWIQQVNFLVFGVLTMVFAAGLYRVLAPSRAGVLGSALLFVSGVAVVLAGARSRFARTPRASPTTRAVTSRTVSCSSPPARSRSW